MGKKAANYQVFSLKWRPQTFDEVVGQDVVTDALRSEIAQGRIANAYIFAGPRGVGKTSIARILAKALNCEKGMTPEPCNTCRHCKGITVGSDMDVIEIDGASYTGVDNIRDLQEGINLAPFAARKKVYVIDEVHMLSQSAFNALLKTLEEPPEFVTFVFATTEPHKIPETIRSRCQFFTFNRISVSNIITQLDLILSKEKQVKVQKDEKAKILEAIALNAEGSMRDAEVTLDQLVSLTEGELSLEATHKLLGLVESEVLLQVLESIRKRDATKALEIVKSLVDNGRDLQAFVRMCISFLRDVMLLKASGKDAPLELPADRISRLTELAQGVSFPFLLNVLNNFFMLEEKMKGTLPERFLLEFTLIKLTSIDRSIDIETLLSSEIPSGVTGASSSPLQSGSSSTTKSPGNNGDMFGSLGQSTSGPTTSSMPDHEPRAFHDTLPASASPSPAAKTATVEEDAQEESLSAPLNIDDPDSVWERFILLMSQKEPIMQSILKDVTPESINKNVFRIRVFKNAHSEYTLSIIK